MRRGRDGTAQDLAELIDGRAIDSSRRIDTELAPLARIAAELRDHAPVPPSPRRATLRAELVARHGPHRHRRAATLAILAGAMTMLTGVVAVAALPAAEPVRDAVQSLLGSWMRPTITPVATATPSDDPEGSPAPAPSLPGPIASAPAELPDGAGATHAPVASGGAPPVPSDGTAPGSRPQASPPARPTPSAIAPPSPPRPTPQPTGPPWPQLPSPAVTPPPLP